MGQKKTSARKTLRMRSSSQRTNLSVWSATASVTRTPSLNNNARADVCVIGGGIAGITIAYLLAREGQSVVLIDKNQVGRRNVPYERPPIK
jgi:heterodisulfide reductase subunit A-like polyferredoxin